MLKKVFFGAFWLLFTVAAMAQAPGYLGKKIAISLDGQWMLATTGPTAANYGGASYGGQHSKLGSNWRAGLTAGYALTRSRQLMVGVDRLRTGAVGYAETENLFQPFAIDQHSLFFNLKSTTLSAGYRNFRLGKGAIAPLGKYGGWSLAYTRTAGEILDKRTVFGTGIEESAHGKLGISPKANTISAAYEFGTNWVVADQILLSFGGRFSFPLNLGDVRYLESDGFTQAEYGEIYEGDFINFQKSNQKMFREMVTTRLLWHSWFTMRLGVSYIF